MLDAVPVLTWDSDRLLVPAGGVGGRGLVERPARASGSLPAASRSNGDSVPSSARRFGGSGSGLLTSEADGGVLCRARGWVVSMDVGRLGSLAAPPGAASAPSSILMSFPCLELGGGGFLRPDADWTVDKGEDGWMPRRSPFSSASEIS